MKPIRNSQGKVLNYMIYSLIAMSIIAFFMPLEKLNLNFSFENFGIIVSVLCLIGLLFCFMGYVSSPASGRNISQRKIQSSEETIEKLKSKTTENDSVPQGKREFKDYVLKIISKAHLNKNSPFQTKFELFYNLFDKKNLVGGELGIKVHGWYICHCNYSRIIYLKPREDSEVTAYFCPKCKNLEMDEKKLKWIDDRY